MTTLEVTPTWNGRPLAELNRLIGRRMALLGESSRDAVIATAIIALQSIRKATKKCSPRRVKATKGGVSYALVEDAFPAFTKGGVRCLRRGSRRGGRRIATPEHTVQLVAPGEDWRLAHLFRVDLTDEQHARWPKQPKSFLVVARSETAAESYLDKRYSKIAERQGGLARLALGKAMAAISSRPPAQGRVGAHAPAVANRAVRVYKADTRQGYEVRVHDALVYAAHAVNGGRAGVDNALKSAANRVAGRLRHMGAHLLDPDLQTPFPEVAHSRKGA